MAAVEDYRTRCFVCRTRVRRFWGAWTYFSYSRGAWWRVPLCNACARYVLHICDEARRTS